MVDMVKRLSESAGMTEEKAKRSASKKYGKNGILKEKVY